MHPQQKANSAYLECEQPMKIVSEIHNTIGIITLNHPEKSNAIDVEMRDALINALCEYDQHPAVRVILLLANGKHFCAGADLNHMQAMMKAPYADNLADAKALASLFFTLYSCQKPTVCFAQGKSIGGGVGVLAACDIAIADPKAAFCFSEVKIGLLPAVIAPFVIQRIGFQSAQYHMMTANLFDAKTALSMQLIDHVCEKDKAMQQVDSLLQNTQKGMEGVKKWLRTLHPISPETMRQAAEKLADIRHHQIT